MSAKHLVFMIHGMGIFNKNWSAPYVDQLRKAYGTFPQLSFDAFDDLFDFEELTYDDLFETYRTRWKQRADLVGAELVANGFQKSAANDLIDLASTTEGDDFLRTHVLDVIMYRFLPTIAEQIRVRIMKSIQTTLGSYGKNDIPSYSILAHSLGTGVITASLHEWMTDSGWRDTAFASRFRPENLFMVANCSRVLWSLGGQFYRNAVRPFPTETQGACAYYGHYGHPLDPFTHALPFDPPNDSWYFPGTDHTEVYGAPNIAVDDIVKLNVHALEHYLAHPAVHVDIFRRLRRSATIVSPQELKAALNTYYDSTLVGKALVDARKKLTEFTISDSESWHGVVKAITDFRALVSGGAPNP